MLKLSRTKIELFIQCPRCFYLDVHLGIKRPSIPAFTLNSAVDALLKKEFDIHRAKGQPHPLMKKYKIAAVPLAHEKMDGWRHNFTGVQYYDRSKDLLLFGAVDDIWINKKKEFFVVDYKTTSTSEEIKLEGGYKEAYKRQMEFYQWLLRKNDFVVSDLGYFVYCNGRKDKEAFDGKLEFAVQIIEYCGNDNWVENEVQKAYQLLQTNDLPAPTRGCEYCNFAQQWQKNV